MSKIGWKLCPFCRVSYFKQEGHKCKAKSAEHKKIKKLVKVAKPKVISSETIPIKDIGVVEKTATEVVEQEKAFLEEKAPELQAATDRLVEPLIEKLTSQQRWRAKNKEHYLAKQREYQKAYRERQK